MCGGGGGRGGGNVEDFHCDVVNQSHSGESLLCCGINLGARCLKHLLWTNEDRWRQLWICSSELPRDTSS